MKIRTSILALSTGLCLTIPACGSHSAPAPEPLGTNAQAVMTLTDPNRDATWDWTAGWPTNMGAAATTVPLVFQDGSTVTAGLPYFDGGSPAWSFYNVDNPDILPRDGWTLFLRDFGTPASGTTPARPASPLPFFILYNRYRGILRLFYYVEYQPSYTSVVGSLSFSSTKTTALLTLQDVANTGNSFTQSYDPTRPITAVGATGQGWCMLDFSVLGFDPTTPSTTDPQVVINLAAVTTDQIALSGNIDLKQQMGAAQAKKSSTSGSCPTCNSIAGDFTEAGTIYSDAQKALKALGASASGDDEGGSGGDDAGDLGGASSTISTILSDVGDVASWIPALSPIGAILKLVVGGGTANNTTTSPPPAPLIFHGDLTLNGTLTSNAPWFDINFVLPGSQHLNPTDEAEENVLPFYDLPLGIFNLESQPQYTLYEYEDDVYTKCPPPPAKPCLDGETLDIETTWLTQTTAPLLADVNFYVFDKVDSLDLGTTNTMLPMGFLPSKHVANGDYRASNLDTTSYYYPCGQTPCEFQPAVDYVMSAQLHPRDAAAGVTDVTVIRDYQVAPTYSHVLSKPTQTSTGLHPRPSSLVAVSPGGLGLEWMDNDGSETGEILTEVFTPSGSTTPVTSVISLPAGTHTYSSPVLPVAAGRYQFTVATYEGSTSSPSAPSNTVTFTVAPTVIVGGSSGGLPVAF